MRDYPKFFCILAAVSLRRRLARGQRRRLERVQAAGRRPARIIAACARIVGDKRSAPRERAIALNNRGNAYQTNKDFGRAIADYDAALRLDPKLAHTYLNRALALKGDGEYARALADANKSLELEPADPVALRGRGDIYVARGKKAEGDLDSRSPITPRRSGSIRATRSPIATAAWPSRPRATANTRATITTW